MLEKLKEIGQYLLGILFFVGIITASIFLFKGSAWVSMKVLPWLFLITLLGAVISLVILLPLSLINRTRIVGATGLFFMSYLFGVTLWFWGFLLSYIIWGWVGLIVGLVIAGVGVVPIAIIACAVNGLWSVVLQLLILVVLTYGTRLFSMYLFEKIETRKSENY